MPKKESTTASRHRRRALWGLVLAAGLAVVGMASGTALGARFFVPEGSGLAGPAIALGHGFVGALLGLIAAGLLVWKAPPAVLRRAGLAALLLALATIGLVAWRAVKLNRQGAGQDRTPAPSREPAPIGRISS